MLKTATRQEVAAWQVETGWAISGEHVERIYGDRERLDARDFLQREDLSWENCKYILRRLDLVPEIIWKNWAFRCADRAIKMAEATRQQYLREAMMVASKWNASLGGEVHDIARAVKIATEEMCLFRFVEGRGKESNSASAVLSYVMAVFAEPLSVKTLALEAAHHAAESFGEGDQKEAFTSEQREGLLSMLRQMTSADERHECSDA